MGGAGGPYGGQTETGADGDRHRWRRPSNGERGWRWVWMETAIGRRGLVGQRRHMREEPGVRVGARRWGGKGQALTRVGAWAAAGIGRTWSGQARVEEDQPGHWHAGGVEWGTNEVQWGPGRRGRARRAVSARSVWQGRVCEDIRSLTHPGKPYPTRISHSFRRPDPANKN
jgi:hypothetical protein